MMTARLAENRLASLVILLGLAAGGCGKQGSAPGNKPTTYEGTWTGTSEAGMHVREIVFDKSRCPCDGMVTLHNDGTTIRRHVVWQEKDGKLVGMFGPGEQKDPIATVRMSAGELSGEVTFLSKEFRFTGFQKQK